MAKATRGRHTVGITAQGHPAIRASHAKTLELTTQSQITSRATCVIGVNSRLPQELWQLRGRVQYEVTVQLGDRQMPMALGTAIINPQHRVRERLILRRSNTVDADTLATHSTLVAENLDRETVAALRDPEAVVRMTVTELAAPPSLVLRPLGQQPDASTSDRLQWLAQHADGTRTWQIAPDLPADRHPQQVHPELPNPARYALGHPRQWAREALWAAGLPWEPAVYLGEVASKRDTYTAALQTLQTTAVPVVFRTTRTRLYEILDAVSAPADHPLAVPDAVPDLGTGMVWTTRGDLSTPAAPDTAADTDALEPVVWAPAGPRALVAAEDAIAAMAGQGVPARTIAQALAPWGITRRQVYQLLHRLTPLEPSNQDRGKPRGMVALNTHKQ